MGNKHLLLLTKDDSPKFVLIFCFEGFLCRIFSFSLSPPVGSRVVVSFLVMTDCSFLVGVGFAMVRSSQSGNHVSNSSFLHFHFFPTACCTPCLPVSPLRQLGGTSHYHYSSKVMTWHGGKRRHLPLDHDPGTESCQGNFGVYFFCFFFPRAELPSHLDHIVANSPTLRN